MRPFSKRICRLPIQRLLYNDSQATKVANLGAMTEYLSSEAVPHMLSRTIKTEKLDPQIKLRLLPTQHPYLPSIQGPTKYKHSITAIGLIIRSFVLHGNAILHVTGVETITGVSKSQRYNTITGNDKIVIHWHSCDADGYYHANSGNSTSQANLLFSNAKDNINLKRETDSLPYGDLLQYIMNPSLGLSRDTINEQTKSLDDYRQQEGNSRSIHGYFIFELNCDNTKILVHTIDNVEMLDKPKKQETGALAC
ncbi:LANO_0D09846g1_1 [Lachancea nothofagi CBS 11611]|uniref:LANO_0D09846g1_1 n=1 Tax=Lachancea nothofagi CBS 11611 TaxID=1266666 RepID=A0A1G4JJQ6_9SACH|nr:LANO_0D09846g1_1 [Lachancea nothofagi CBS 11611]